jgi:hypothetical protein
MGRVSLKAAILYDRMWINADDQGRLSGDPDEIKYTTCPNLPDISKEEIPNLLKELAATKPGLIEIFITSKTEAIQMLDWWEVQRLQWAYPSEYSPPEGWTDHLRYHPTPKEIITENWPPSGQPADELLPSKLPSALPNTLPSKLQSKVSQTLPTENEKEKEGGKGNRRGRGRLPSALPSALGSRPPPSLTGSFLFESLVNTFPEAFGKKPNSREVAQLRDLGEEISSAGGATVEHIRDAFKEAATQNKFSVRYVRAILLDWLGMSRAPPA